MELLFLILKIILTVFLAALGFIIVLLALVLLVPIHYEVSGNLGDSWELQLKGKITYCLSILRLIFSYQNGQTDIRIYLFGFQKKLKKEAVREEPEKEPAEVKEITDREDVADREEISGREEVADREEISDKEEISDASPPAIPDKDAANPNRKENTAEKNTHKAKKRKAQRKKVKKENKEKSRFDFAFWKQQITDEHNQNAVKKIWKELLYLLKHFRFRKIQTDLRFSIGDPAFTGQVFGILCMIPMLYRYEFKIVPDFEAEEFYVKGTFLIGGKVRLVHLPIVMLRLIFDKEVRLAAENVISLMRRQ